MILNAQAELHKKMVQKQFSLQNYLQILQTITYFEGERLKYYCKTSYNNLCFIIFYSVYCKSLPFSIYQHQSYLLIWLFKCSCFVMPMKHIETQRGRGRRQRRRGKEGGWEKECYDVTPVVCSNTKAAEKKTHIHTRTHAAACFTNTTPQHTSPASECEYQFTLLSLSTLHQHLAVSLSSSLQLFILSFSRSLCILSLSPMC